MKRIGNLYSKIISIENLYEASRKAQKGKKNYSQVKRWNDNLDENILSLHLVF